MTRNIPLGKLIVKVSAGFAAGDELFEWIKKYAQSYDDDFAFWEDIAFTVADIPEADGALVFNTPSAKISLQCSKEKVIAFMMEPGVYHEHPWMYKRLDQYSKVYSPIVESANTIRSHGYLGWYFAHNYPFLQKLPVPVKTKQVSCIASDLKQLKGHRARTGFIELLGRQIPEIDLFGKGRCFLPDKMDGLLPYRYSIAIENTSGPYYFTEKINDCFLAYTVPLYYGCSNIGDFFPERSFIQIDIKQPEKAIGQIKQILAKDDWHNRLDALREARELVLNKYQPLAGAADILSGIKTSGEKECVTLQPVSPTVNRRIRTFLLSLGNR